MVSKLLCQFLLSLCLCSIWTLKADAQIVYVTQTGAGTNDGTSWANAKNGLSLRAVISTLPSNGEVWIAEGTYYPHPTNRNSSFQIFQNRKIYGGFAGTETNLADRNWELHPTILSGDIGSIGNNADNSYVVLEVVSSSMLIPDTVLNAVIDGFTITKGNNTSNGAGIMIRDGVNRPKFLNCTVSDNYAKSGAAVYDSISFTNRPYFYNCTFKNNSAEYGSVYTRTPQGYYGGATFEKCSFINNTATNANTFGGCFYWYTWSTTADVYNFKNCLFKENILPQSGFFHATNAGSIVMEGCRFTKNKVANMLLHLNNTDFNMSYCTIDSNDATVSSAWPMLYFFTAAKAVTNIQGATYSPQQTKIDIANSKFIQNYTSSRFMHISTGTGSLTLAITNTDSTKITNCLFYNCGRNSTLYQEGRLGGKSNILLNNSTFYNDSVFIEFKAWDRQIGQFATKGNQPTNPTPGNARMYINNSIIYQPEFWPGTRSIRSEYSLYNSIPGEKILEVRNTAFHAGGGQWPDLGGSNMGGNLINVNPQFVDPYGDFRLKCTSPLINAGMNALYSTALPSMDLDSNNRIAGGTIDMGAYEFRPIPLHIYPSVTINELNLQMNIGSNLPIDSLRWNLGDGNSGHTNPVDHNYTSSGTYTVCITIYANCTTKDTCITVTAEKEPTGLNDDKSLSTLKLYPNPARAFTTVDGITGCKSISLFNLLGQQLFTFKPQQSQATIWLSDYPSGVYMLRIQANDGSYTSLKFIKE